MSAESWNHCPGNDNPADLPSRGLPPLELSANTLWHEGPAWLRGGDPCSDVELQPTTDCLAEMRVKDRPVAHGLLATNEVTGLSQIMDCTQFSSLDRLCSVTALVLKFCTNLLAKIRPEVTASCGHTKRTAEEWWIAECQRVMVADKKFQRWQGQLDLFQDDSGIWRCRGRIQNAVVPYSTKHPVLLHKTSLITLLCWLS